MNWATLLLLVIAHQKFVAGPYLRTKKLTLSVFRCFAVDLSLISNKLRGSIPSWIFEVTALGELSAAQFEFCVCNLITPVWYVRTMLILYRATPVVIE